ncbi:MAG: hypothetical protein HRU10_11395 [Opitutales bacterium]|nr:hypothetical protein [Opitutales bacterium]
MKSKYVLTIMLFFLSGIGSHGQVSTRHNALPNAEVFGIEVDGRQAFYGRVRGINSVSTQSYLTPAFAVTEMVIDMIHSPLQLRIYSTTPLDAVGSGSSAVRAATQDVPISSAAVDGTSSAVRRLSEPVRDRLDAVGDTTPVVKDYPLTTHSKTIEYKLPSAGHVVALFREFSELWLAMPEAVEEARSADQESQLTGRISPLSRVIFTIE